MSTGEHANRHDAGDEGCDAGDQMAAAVSGRQAPQQLEVAASSSLPETLRTFGRVAGFPDYYGANLDALLDCLRDAPALQVSLTDAERLRLADPEGYRALVDVLRQARAELPDFHFSISR